MTESKPKVWLCRICGYIHHGEAPPDVCPICGAGADMFELIEEPEPRQEKKVLKWRCLVCGYEHEGPRPPEICPVCGASADQFEPVEETAAAQSAGQSAGKIVILGGGIAGNSAAESAKKNAPLSEVVLVSAEDRLPYYRLNLTRYLAGELSPEQLPLHPEQWFRDSGITLMQGSEAKSLDFAKKEVLLQDGSRLSYDKLILTTGAHAFLPPFPGSDKENVTTLRTVADADRILSMAGKGKRCTVIGGGILGLETAGALAKRGMKVTLLEGHGWLLPRQLNRTAGEILESYAAARGITLRKNTRTREIMGDGLARAVLLEEGVSIPCDLVVITTGVRANSWLARQAGLEVDRGIIVNDRMQTSHSDIYAAGDVCQHRGISYGIWAPAQYQGAAAGINAAGGTAEFAGIPRSNVLKVLGYDLFSIGTIEGTDASFRETEAESEGTFARFVFQDGKMAGAILLGDTSLSAKVKTVVEEGRDCTPAIGSPPRAADILKWLKEQA